MSEKQALLEEGRSDDQAKKDRFEEENAVTWTAELKQTGIFVLSVLLLCGGIFVVSYFFANNSFNTGLDSRLQAVFLNSMSTGSIKTNFETLTSNLLLQGTKGSLALVDQMELQFNTSLPLSSIVTIQRQRYDVLISTPNQQSSVQLLGSNNQPIFTAQLFENQISNDSSTNLNKDPRAYAFTAYSPAGNVATSNYYYVNFGSQADFAYLASKVALNGSIVIARAGSILTGLKVQNAEKAGCAGIILYNDPQQDGYVLGSVYPDGEFRPDHSIERGSAQYTSLYPGDPTTPGNPSIPGTNLRIPRTQATNIPQTILVQTISAKDAKTILSNLGGDNVPTGWTGAIQGLTYKIGGQGNGNTQLQLNVQNFETAQQPIYNVIATIEGEFEPDRVVVIANARDAFTFGGVSPQSGTAAFLEVVKGFGNLLKNTKWRPRRTIMFISFDAEKYGNIGSTEWIEQYAESLKLQVVSFLTINDVYGNNFYVISSPALSSVIRDEALKIQSPSASNETLADSWDQNTYLFRRVTPLYHLLGISGINMRFTNDEGVIGVLGSLYETQWYYENFIDPNFQYTLTTANIFGLVAVRLVNDDILPFNHTELGLVLKQSFNGFLTNPIVNNYNNSLTGTQQTQFLSFISQVQSLVLGFDSSLNALQSEIKTISNMGKQSKNYDNRLRNANDRSTWVEKSFTNRNGINGRSIFKNVIFSVDRATGFGPVLFPAVMDAINDNNFNNVVNAFQQVIETLTNSIYLLQ